MTGSKLEILRELKNFTQEHLAEKLGITQNSYSRLESGKTKITLDYVRKIAAIYEVDDKKLYEYLTGPDKINIHKIINETGLIAFASENFTYNNNKPEEGSNVTGRIAELEKNIKTILDILKAGK